MADVKFDYDAIANLAQMFNQAGEELQSTAQTAQQMANVIESGALLGKGGQALVNSMPTFINSINKLAADYQAYAMKMYQAMQDMRAEDEEAAGRFG